MTPEQAQQVGDVVVERQRAADRAARNATARRVPFGYYVRGLNDLEPWERSSLVQTASRHVANQWRVALLALLLATACSFVWWKLGYFARGDGSPVLLVFVITAIAYLPRTFLVRREIRERLKARSTKPDGIPSAV